MSLTTGNQAAFSAGGGGGGNVTSAGMAIGTIPIVSGPFDIETGPLHYVPIPAPGVLILNGDNRFDVAGILTHSTGVPIITPGPALGLGGLATLLRGNDMAGLVQMNFANAGLVPGIAFTVTFSHAYPGQLKGVFLSMGQGYANSLTLHGIPYVLQTLASGGAAFEVHIDSLVGYNLLSLTIAYLVIG